jgi:hypothetical protein
LFQEKTPWLHTHWLGSYLLYELFRFGDVGGVKFARALYFLLVIGVFFVYFFRKVRFSLLMLLSVLLAYGLSTRYWLKPDIINCLFAQILLIILMTYERRGSVRILYALPLLGMLWFNVHLGALIYGGVILGILGVSFLPSAIPFRASGSGFRGGDGYAARVIPLGLATAGFFLSFFITPLGFEGVIAQLKIFFSSRDTRLFYDTLKYVHENQPPLLFWQGAAWAWGLTGLAVVVFYFGRHKLRLFHVLFFVVSLGMFLFMRRNSAFFALLAAYVIAHIVSRMDHRERQELFTGGRRVDGAVILIAVLVMAYQIWVFATDKVFYTHRVERTAFLKMRMPELVRGMDLLKKEKVEGLVFQTELSEGGYILWAGYPRLRPFLDGRSIDFNRYLEVLAVCRDPEKEWPEFERKYAVNIVIIRIARVSRKFLGYLDGRPDWQLIFAEGEEMFYVRRGVFPLTGVTDSYQKELRSMRITAEDMAALRAISDSSSLLSLRERVDPPPYYVYDWEMGLTLLSLGYDGAGVRKIINGARHGDAQMRRQTGRILEALSSVVKASWQ